MIGTKCSRFYRGWIVSRQTEPGKLGWRAWRSGELPLAGDTLAGVKRLIRERG